MALDRRLQLLLDEERYRRVAELAGQRGTSVAAVIREAIDRGLPSPDRRRRAAARHLLDAEPAQAPDVPDLLAELDELRGRRM
jgi:hypothetical protein